MSDILTRLEMAVAENNTAAIINLVKGELMDAVGKTILELPCEVGDTVYRQNGYLVHPGIITEFFTREGKWWFTLHGSIDVNWPVEKFGKDVFLTEQAAKDALERGKPNERN